MSAFTPGPWRDCNREIGALADLIAQRNTIKPPAGEAHSNARLIAQAPAMAELLRAIVADDPLYSDAEEGTFCVHCFAMFTNHKGITHKPDCAHVRAAAILSTIEGK